MMLQKIMKMKHKYNDKNKQCVFVIKFNTYFSFCSFLIPPLNYASTPFVTHAIIINAFLNPKLDKQIIYTSKIVIVVK